MGIEHNEIMIKQNEQIIQLLQKIKEELEEAHGGATGPTHS